MGAGTPSVAAATDQASAGVRSVRFDLANPNGQGKVWIMRQVQATPGQSYSAQVSLKLGVAEPAGAAPWKVIAGLQAPEPLLTAQLGFQDETSSAPGNGAFSWVAKSYTVAAKADDEGRLWLTLGIWGTSPGTRTYWVDEVRVALTRS